MNGLYGLYTEKQRTTLINSLMRVVIVARAGIEPATFHFSGERSTD